MDDGTLFDIGDADGEEARLPTLTVEELATRIARATAEAFPTELWVSGQIRNLNRSAAGHVYFNLTDPTPVGSAPKVQMSVTLLARERQAVNRELNAAGGSVRMDDGIEVRLRGRIQWYAPRGTLQIRMFGIDPDFTLGRLQADRDRILALLRSEGLLEANGLLMLPVLPLRVGLVTSRDTAAYADVMHELEGSGFGFHVLFADARTQGADSGPSVCRALATLAERSPDVVLVVRGGGARTDLAAFDGEDVARAIAAMPVPVFTGIGHEIDRSIADEVASAAHKTPTAAAAGVVAIVRDFVERMDRSWDALLTAAASSCDAADERLARRADRAANAAGRGLRVHTATVLDRSGRVARAAARALERAGSTLDATVDGVALSARRSLQRSVDAVGLVEARVNVHDPVHALARGWSITTTADGRPVDLGRLSPGDTLSTRLAAGTVTSTVTAVSAEPLPATNEQRSTRE